MPKRKNHIIQKFHLEVNTPSPERGKKLEKRAANLLKQKLFPRMEKIFGKYGKNQTIRLEKLTMEINTLESDRWEEELLEKILAQLARELDKARIERDQTEAPQTRSRGSTFDTFIFFLKTGHLPWWAGDISLKELEEKVLEDFRKTNVEEFSVDEKMIRRLIFQFSNKLLQMIFEKKEGTALPAFLKTNEKNLSKNLTPEEVRKLIAQLLKKVEAGKNSKSEIKQPKINKKKPGSGIKEPKTFKKERLEETDAWYIKNAGLVILHPFLQSLFEEIGYTRKGKFVDSAHQNQAALLLQYLVTGETETFENELVLNKILCGIPIGRPAERELILAEKIKREADNLLKSTIKHWSALKNTSPDGLRNTFLMREGKLTKKENGDWKLFIEQNTFDILISKLPWSISVIKFPWMKKMLRVEWA